MDDVSIISIPDSDISLHTLIEFDETALPQPDQSTSTQLDQSTPNQQFYACSLFLNHWLDGTTKTNEDLRSAKKYYVEGLKEKPIENLTITFEKKTSEENMKAKLSKEKTKQISGRCAERSRSPSKSNKSDESRKRKSSDCHIDLQKKKRDENHNQLVGITGRRKTTYLPSITSTATIARRQTILIDPMIHTQTPNRHNPFAATNHTGQSSSSNKVNQGTSSSASYVNPFSATNHTGHSSSGNRNIKAKQRTSSSSSNDTVKFEGHRLATTSISRISGAENKIKPKDHLPKPKDDSKHSSSSRVPKHLSSIHRPASSSHRPASSHSTASSTHQYGPSYRRESSSTHRSSNSRERVSKKRRSSKDSQQSNSEKKSRLSEDKSKSKPFPKESAEKYSSSNLRHSENVSKAAQRMDNVTADKLKESIKHATAASLLREMDLFEMEDDATSASSSRENPFKNYKIPKNGGYSKQSKSNDRNASPTKSSCNDRFNTSPSTENLKPSTTPKSHKRPNDERRSGPSLTTVNNHRNNCQEKKTPVDATTSRQKTSESKKPQNVDDKNVVPVVPELDGCIIPAMNPTVLIKPIKFNPLNRNVTVKKEAIATGNGNYMIRYENEKIIITKDKKHKHRKASEHSSRKESNKVDINDIATHEAVTNDIANEVIVNEDIVNEVIENEAAGKVVSSEVSTNAFASDGVASEPVVHMAIQTNSSHHHHHVEDNNNIRIQIDSSQQTEVYTSNFGGQKNDDEMNELVKEQQGTISLLKEAVQEYEESIKERDNKIVYREKTITEQQNMIEEREKIIKERDRMIAERDLMIREREQKFKEYEDKIRMQEHKINMSDAELITLKRSNNSLVAMLNDKDTYCKENHKEKPKPRNLKSQPQSNSHPQIIQQPNVPLTSNLNGFQNNIPRITPQQTILVRNINELTGNSPSILRPPSSTIQSTFYSSSPSLALLLTNSANSTNTFSNTNTPISNVAPTLFSNAAPTLSNNSGPTTIRNAAPTSISNVAFASSSNTAPTLFSNAATNLFSNAATNLFSNAGSTSINNTVPTLFSNAAPTSNSNAVSTLFSNAAPTLINNSAPTAINNTAPTSIRNGAFTSIGNNGQTSIQQDPQQVRVQGPNLEWSFDLDPLGASSISSSPTYPQTSQPRISVSQNLYPTQPTTSAATQPNSSGVMTSISGNVHTPHQMIPRQPQRTKSVSARHNQLKTINQSSHIINSDENLSPAQRLQQRSQLRNRSNTTYYGTPNIINTQRLQQNHLQHTQKFQQVQQVQQRVSPQSFNQSTVFPPSVSQQPVFYCLGCYKTAKLVCATCRNCCSCSEFCYDLIAAKHKSDCILPNMVSISSLS